MKSYLTEADTTAPSETSSSSARRPFKLLQNIQHCHDSLRSKMAASSSALRSITNRPRRFDTSAAPAKSGKANESQGTRNRSSVNASRQKNILNGGSTVRTVPEPKKQDLGEDPSGKSLDSNNAVGSLTSSPKWSHIKNKFENGLSVEKNKLCKTTSLNSEDIEPGKIKHSDSKSLNSLAPDAKLTVSRFKVVSRKDAEKAPNNCLTIKSRLNEEKSRLDSSVLKGVQPRDRLRTRSKSPKNSLNNSRANSSTAKLSKNTSSKAVQNSSVSPKNSQLHKTLTSSSVSLSSNSSKNSELDDPNSNSSSVSCSSIKNISQTSHHLNGRSSPKSSLSSNVRSTSPKSIESKNFTSNISALHSGLDAKRRDERTVSSRLSSKIEVKSNPSSITSDETSHSDQSQIGKKSLFTEKDRQLLNNISNINKSCRSNALSNDSSTTTIDSSAHNPNSVERIRDLVKNSQPSTKTIWVKDNAGNWVKKGDTAESKCSVQSKVAKLKSKFLETSEENHVPVSKSVTTNNVPSKTGSQFSRPLAKSSTTSSICDKTFSDDLNEDPAKTTTDNTSQTHGRQKCDTRSTQNSKPLHAKRNSVDSDAKLNIVQRAILSYEGNLALLSPESQRRLKLVNNKVQAQTDDDKILQAKTHNDGLNWVNSSQNNSKNKSSNIGNKKPDPKVVGEPVVPTREFLSRFNLVNRDLKKSPNLSKNENTSSNSKAEKRETVPNGDSLNKDKSTAFAKGRITEKSNGKPIPDEKCNRSELTVSASSQNRENLTLNLSGNQLSVTTSTSQGTASLIPNASFLWRQSTVTSNELSKSCTSSSVSLTSSDYRNYYDIQNYYSTLDLEIEKRSENSEEPLYIDSQESNSSDNYASSSGPYQNVPPRKDGRNNSCEEWTDISDDDYIKGSISSNQSSTIKRKKNKRSVNNSQKSTSGKIQLNDTISFTDSNDTLINDEVGNESTFELSDANHFYEPVYESLGNYLINQDDQDGDNCSISLSPDDQDHGDSIHCSMTSLESAEDGKQEKDSSNAPAHALDKNGDLKKSNNKISQLRRHLSWTKNDIRLELSSKFNKIKIKKNGQNSTEIGVKMQEDTVNTSPKKKTFIKCILRQKSSSSIPVKRSPSPKKESSHFYVHLSMESEKPRPSSEPGVSQDAAEALAQKLRKQSEPSLLTSGGQQQRPRFRKVASGPTVQRPKTPPPLPPNLRPVSNGSKTGASQGSKMSSLCSDSAVDLSEPDSHLYTCLDPDYFQRESSTSSSVFYDVETDRSDEVKDCRTSKSTSRNDLSETKSSRTSDYQSTVPSRKTSIDIQLSRLPIYQSELLKSPFEEEPLYQFYQKDVQQRATLWYNAEGSESDFEDDSSSKFSDSEYQLPSKPPVLQSQMSAMDLVHGEGGQRTLWCEVPEVIESGILKTISSKDRKIQEAMFEVITSEASYLKSLNFLIEHFVQCPEFNGGENSVLDKRERHVLFSDIQPVRDVSAHLLADLEKRWLENIVLSNICDIVYHHASKYFSVYVKYCSNQLYQERLLRELKEKRPEFIAVLKQLESNTVCQGLDMHSFLMLPMQRITRLPLLIDAIFHRLSPDSPIYGSCKMALAMVNKLVAECNEGARKMERMEEMLVISQQLDFKDCKGFGLLSASRWLVKKGELVQLLLDTSSRRTFGRSSRWCKVQLHLFLFTDLLVVTRKKSDDSYSVVDFCPRNMLQVLSVDENMPPFPVRLPSSYRNLFQMIMLNNKEGKTVEMLLSCLLESDRTRWMDAMTPAKSENPDEKIYEEWDWPQFQCTHAYNAQQPDELSLEEADVVNVLRKMSDGWFEGERIRDGVRGWFPSSHAVEIITSHVRARNLRQRYRLLMLSQTYLEEQYKAQAAKK